MFFEFDHFHGNHFEVYNKRGKHIGVGSCDGTLLEANKQYAIDPLCSVQIFKRK